MKKEEFYREARSDMTGPLQGVRVLEATTSQAGPIAGTVLADLGANVIKIDLPEMGDIMRHLPPFIEGAPKLNSSCYHLSINRNKKNISLAINRPAGQEVFRKLAAKMDVIVQNFKPGTMDKWGLGYEAIKKIKPDIVYVSVSGFGQFGPNHQKPGYDPVGQAIGGLMNVNGYADGPPTRTGNAMADNITGWQGAIGALAALHHRQMTGEGQHVDVCLVDSILYTSDYGVMAASNAGFNWKRMGSGNPAGGPCDVYRCKDGYVFILVLIDSHHKRFWPLIGRPELYQDPRMQTPVARAQNLPFINQVVGEWTQDKTVEEVVRQLEEAQLVVTPIFDFPQIVRNEHLREREMVTEVEYPDVGKLTIYGVAAKFSRTPCKVRTHAPAIGQHNEEVFGELLDLGAEELAQLQQGKII
ncbi:MAG: CoA transferase [Nitrospinae bacterium]|nr:CoA transferase [Nitrospinota bacterium]